MRMPIRKPDKYLRAKTDPNITEDKFIELKTNLERLKKIRPKVSEEVKLLSEGGDFSENAGYQSAKGKLRGINSRILEIEDRLSCAIIIKTPINNGRVQIGSNVTVEVNNIKKTFLILGSTEVDPAQGIISGHSPIGAALVGRQVGEVVKINLTKKNLEYKIIKIE